jgi:hypothetical protein
MGKRGCGYRSPGGVYLRVVVSEGGTIPVESCLVCSPKPVPESLGVPNRGVLILERNDGSGIWDVYDRVGSKHYPNVADFIEETKREGVSRRVKRDTRNLDKLTRKSRIFLIHERAIITNAHTYYRALADERVDMANPPAWWCRKDIEEHNGLVDLVPTGRMGVGAPMCVSLFWEDITGGEMQYDPDLPVRTVTREIGSNSYRGRKRCDGLKPVYAPGIFFNFPIHCLDVIRDPEGHEDIRAMEYASKTGLPVRLEDS